MDLRQPIFSTLGRLLQILIYARYSTDEQNPKSIDDQVSVCRKYLRQWGIVDANVEVISDPETSGELRSRPGINQVRAGIDARRWDLIIAEDSSRLFRDPVACAELVGTADDEGIRVILPGDYVDTKSEDWMDRLGDAQQHHARSNFYTRKRIKRSHDGLWEMGAAIGHVAPGYKRRATYPATQRQPESGPFYDEVDPLWAPVVRSAFERIAAGDPGWLVAKALTEAGLPKCANAQKPQWSTLNVIALIRRPVYRGEQQFRKEVQKKMHRTGKSKPVANLPDKILTRSMPTLRIVSDELWYAANAAINARRNRVNIPKGREHPLTGKTRDSRGPLSTNFVCGVCGGKMHAEGRHQGGYRCSHARRGDCWNKATALRAFTHATIGSAIVQQLLSDDGVFEDVYKHIESLLRTDEPTKLRLHKLSNQLREAESKRDRLLDLIEGGGGEAVSLLARLREREADITKLQTEFRALEASQAIPRSLPTRQELQDQIANSAAHLLELNADAGALLRRLIPSAIRAVPYQQFDTDKIVLRAEFELDLVGVLPSELFRAFAGDDSDVHVGAKRNVQLSVDLFQPPHVPLFAVRAAQLRAGGLTFREIGEQLETTLRVAELAARMGKKMLAAGITSPYARVTEKPENPSRWRYTVFERNQTATRPSDAA